MNPHKTATPNHRIHELLTRRWSPYAFADRPVSEDDLRSLFEAARWAASSYNEQPWRYIVATRANPAEFERLLSCLVEGNQVWAKVAPVLALGCTSLLANRQLIAQVATASPRHRITTLRGCGHRQRPRLLVSVTRSTTDRASASPPGHSGRPSASRSRCRSPAAGTGPYVSSPPETPGSGV